MRRYGKRLHRHNSPDVRPGVVVVADPQLGRSSPAVLEELGNIQPNSESDALFRCSRWICDWRWLVTRQFSTVSMKNYETSEETLRETANWPQGDRLSQR